jgi:PiT family inorganic phosphate transporter
VSIGALCRETGAPTVGEPGTSSPPASRIGDPHVGQTRTSPARSDLFDPGTTVRVILMQNVVPLLATVASYLTFLLLGTA